MKNLLFTILFALCGVLYGCKDSKSDAPPPDSSVYSENFVQLYVINNDVSLSQYEGRYIAVEFQGELISNRSPAQREAYDKLSQRYNDRSYNNRLPANNNYALANPLSGLNITCRQDFDETHPAGVSLNDIVKLCASSCKEYISNGYQMPETDNTFPGEFAGLVLNKSLGYTPILKQLAEFKSSYELELLDRTCYLYFSQIPQPGDYTFDVSFNMGGGSIKKQITMLF